MACRFLSLAFSWFTQRFPKCQRSFALPSIFCFLKIRQSSLWHQIKGLCISFICWKETSSIYILSSLNQVGFLTEQGILHLWWLSPLSPSVPRCLLLFLTLQIHLLTCLPFEVGGDNWQMKTLDELWNVPHSYFFLTGFLIPYLDQRNFIILRFVGRVRKKERVICNPDTKWLPLVLWCFLVLLCRDLGNMLPLFLWDVYLR